MYPQATAQLLNHSRDERRPSKPSRPTGRHLGRRHRTCDKTRGPRHHPSCAHRRKRPLVSEEDVELIPPAQWLKAFVDALKQLSEHIKNNRLTAISRYGIAETIGNLSLNKRKLNYAVNMRIAFDSGNAQWDASKDRFTREALRRNVIEFCKKIQQEERKYTFHQSADVADAPFH
ncbi:hypothetical protein PSPO01_09012 [Paraphaeosphaeria sporulosa]